MRSVTRFRELQLLLPETLYAELKTARRDVEASPTGREFSNLTEWLWFVLECGLGVIRSGVAGDMNPRLTARLAEPPATSDSVATKESQ